MFLASSSSGSFLTRISSAPSSCGSGGPPRRYVCCRSSFWLFDLADSNFAVRDFARRRRRRYGLGVPMLTRWQALMLLVEADDVFLAARCVVRSSRSRVPSCAKFLFDSLQISGGSRGGAMLVEGRGHAGHGAHGRMLACGSVMLTLWR